MNLRWLRQGIMLTVVSVAATGCHRRTRLAAPPPLPPPPKVALMPAGEPETSEVAAQPLPRIPAPAKAVQPKIRKPKKIEPAEPPPPTPVQVATAEPQPDGAAVIGSLTTGGAAAPAELQKAGSAIAEVEKRLTAVPAKTLNQQKDGMARVRNFLKQAHDALSSGDADGARTLATKAKVLLDDLLK